MLQKNEAKAQELTMTWIDKWNNIENDTNTFVTISYEIKNYLF